MIRLVIFTLLTISTSLLNGQWIEEDRLTGQTRIIDMQVHSYEDSHFENAATDYYGNKGSANATTHLSETFEAFAKHRIVKAVVHLKVLPHGRER